MRYTQSQRSRYHKDPTGITSAIVEHCLSHLLLTVKQLQYVGKSRIHVYTTSTCTCL